MNTKKNRDSRSDEFWNTFVLGKTQAMAIVIKLIDDQIVDDLDDLKQTLERLITNQQKTVK